MARPTKYTPATLTAAREYIDSCTDTHEMLYPNARSGALIWTVKFPSHAGLAIHLGITRETVYQWAKKYPAFSDMLDEIMREQENRLLNQGLAGNYNSTIAKLILAKHGYVDRKDITSDDKPLMPIVVDSTVAARFMDAASESTNDSQE